MSASAPTTDPGWPRLVEAVQRAFRGTPYRVEATSESIVVHADLADARFLTLAAVRRFSTVFRTELRSKGPGRVTWEDSQETISWTAGLGPNLVPRLTGQRTGTRGRIATVQFRKELGVDANGLGFPVDYAFSSGEIAKPLKAAMVQAGFRAGMSRNTIGGIVGASIGGLAVLAVGVAALVNVLL